MNQKTRILEHLKIKGRITPVEALLVHQVFRLAARINELRVEGHDIRTEMKKDVRGVKYAQYTLGV